ncbi:MAG: hypothetical protein ACT4PP_16580 [Sporichthyaceae bacterium]
MPGKTAAVLLACVLATLALAPGAAADELDPAAPSTVTSDGTGTDTTGADPSTIDLSGVNTSESPIVGTESSSGVEAECDTTAGSGSASTEPLVPDPASADPASADPTGAGAGATVADPADPATTNTGTGSAGTGATTGAETTAINPASATAGLEITPAALDTVDDPAQTSPGTTESSELSVPTDPTLLDPALSETALTETADCTATTAAISAEDEGLPDTGANSPMPILLLAGMLAIIGAMVMAFEGATRERIRGAAGAGDALG